MHLILIPRFTKSLLEKPICRFSASFSLNQSRIAQILTSLGANELGTEMLARTKLDKDEQRSLVKLLLKGEKQKDLMKVFNITQQSVPMARPGVFVSS